MAELLGLFLAAFAAATLIPLPSEAALYGYLQLYPEDTLLAVTVATVGNTAGGMTTYVLGRLLPENGKFSERAVTFARRFGAPATFFAWLPIVGDALCAAAGWLRINWLAALGFMAVGRLARYIAVAAMSSSF
jgi:membrane protein YqaA with SNARE-associated domain